MKVLVTGSTGFVGRYVVRELLKRKYRIICPVRNESKAKALFGEDVTIEWVNFEDVDSIRVVLEEHEPDAVIHLIGILFEIKSKGFTFEKVHKEFTENIYKACEGLPVKKFIYMSALGTSPKAPSKYHKTKYEAEIIVKNGELPYTIFRPSLIVGPEQKLFFDMDRISKFLRIIMLPDADSYMFQPIDVRDVACAFVTAVFNRETDNKVYELCGPETVTMKDILDRFFNAINRKVLILSAPKNLMYYLGKIAEAFLEPPPFSSDQILMMWRDNVCCEDEAEVFDFEKYCGKPPTDFESAIGWSVLGYHKLR